VIANGFSAKQRAILLGINENRCNVEQCIGFVIKAAGLDVDNYG
jgi:hypothetical protein